jgi:hypothetical protein
MRSGAGAQADGNQSRRVQRRVRHGDRDGGHGLHSLRDLERSGAAGDEDRLARRGLGEQLLDVSGGRPHPTGPAVMATKLPPAAQCLMRAATAQKPDRHAAVLGKR